MNFNFNQQNNGGNKEEKITIYFWRESNGKEIFLDINKNVTFQACIDALRTKYNWFEFVEFQDCEIQSKGSNKKISSSDFKKTLKSLGIKNENRIIILDAVKDKNEKDNENNQNLTQNNETDKNQDKITIGFYVSCKGSTDNPVDLGN